MKRKSLIFSYFFILLFFTYFNIFAKSHQKRQTIKLIATYTSQEPVLDGKLNDEIWIRPPDVDKPFATYSPTYGDIFPEKTHIWLSYDENNLYFAFYCFDSKPEKIKTSITKRDNMWGDDWIGFNIDSIGNKQSGYVLASNPNGIQGDLYDSTATGTTDEAPDYVWYSAGRIVKDGYIIEIKLPLSSIKYRSGKNVKLNIIFERNITRLGLKASWPEVPTGKGFFAGMATVIYPELKSQPKFEAIPSLTYGKFWDRENPDYWIETGGDLNLGMTLKYTFTSLISGEATLNPDFSQIETDAFQITVNQRYPIFYSEKRPFFMDVGEIFGIAGSTFQCRNMLTAVHTRKMIDPGWGLKLFGESKKLSFGILASDDQWSDSDFEADAVANTPDLTGTEKTLYIAARGKYGLSQDNYIGAIVTSRTFDSESNLVMGGDVYLRLGNGNHFFRSNYLYSISRQQGETEYLGGSSFTGCYETHSKYFDFINTYEHFSRHFQMDTAFINRNGISKLSSWLNYNIYPNTSETSWVSRISPFLFAYYLHDLYSHDNDYILKGGAIFYLIKNGQLRFEYHHFKEYWLEFAYRGSLLNFSGSMQIFNWLNIYSYFEYGNRIYYDLLDPQMGNGFSFDLKITLQPNRYISQFFEYYYQKLDRDVDGEKIYDVNIMNSRTTFQINKHFFVRGILQFDSYYKTLLIDGLISYEFVPGAVIHFGYGSFHEKLYWNAIDNQWLKQGTQMKYYQSKQSLFFKISYRLRF